MREFFPIPLNGLRLTPGTRPAMSQLARPISMTAIRVVFSSRATGDLLGSFGFGMVSTPSVLSDDDGASSLAVRPIASVPATPAERPLSVLLGDLGRDARQRAIVGRAEPMGRVDSGHWPTLR